MKAGDQFYVVIVRWPDGREQQIFPHGPGYQPISDSRKDALAAFNLAALHAREYLEQGGTGPDGVSVRGAEIILTRVESQGVFASAIL